MILSRRKLYKKVLTPANFALLDKCGFFAIIMNNGKFPKICY